MSDTVEPRYVMVSGTVEDNMIIDAIEKITKWNKEDDENEKALINFQREPIEVYINTYGGALHVGLGFSEFLVQSKTPIHTICPAIAMSAGFIMFLGGHKRIAYKQSSIMYHQLSSGIWDNMQAIRLNHERLEEMQARMEDFIISRCKIKKSDLRSKDKIQEDWHFTIAELKKYGIVHEIVGESNGKQKNNRVNKKT